MNQIELDKINVELASWDGNFASLNSYDSSLDELVIGLKGPKGMWDVIGIGFSKCKYISGPTSWSDCKLRCEFRIPEDGGPLIEVRDDESKFLMQCVGPIVAGGSGELTWGPPLT